MSNLSMYILCSLIWGTTWLAVHYQVGNILPAWSICYRFSLAAIIMFIYCLLSKKNLFFSKYQHIFIAIQGLSTHCANFMFFYYGSMYLISGLVAVASASIMLMNIINSKLILNKPIISKSILGAFVGIAGLITVFSGEIIRIDLQNEVMRTNLIVGFILCTIASYCASFGQVLSIRNNKNLSVPILQGTAYSMMYGAIFSACIAMSTGTPPSLEMSFEYITSLIYLSTIGSVITFTMYFKLQNNIGAVKSGYVFVLVPYTALLLSCLIEDFSFHKSIYSGMLLIIIGNVIVLGVPRKVKRQVLIHLKLWKHTISKARTKHI